MVRICRVASLLAFAATAPVSGCAPTEPVLAGLHWSGTSGDHEYNLHLRELAEAALDRPSHPRDFVGAQGRLRRAPDVYGCFDPGCLRQAGSRLDADVGLVVHLATTPRQGYPWTLALYDLRRGERLARREHRLPHADSGRFARAFDASVRALLEEAL